MVSKKILRMGAQKTSIQKSDEINVGQHSIEIDFSGANRTNMQQYTTATMLKWSHEK